MSSDLFLCDDSFFSDEFSSFPDSVDLFQEVENNSNQENPIDEITYLGEIASILLSDSPPSHQLESLSLYQTQTHLENSSDFTSLDVKTEKCQFPIYSSSPSYDYNNNSYSNSNGNSFMMQRSYSSNSFDGKRSNGLVYQPGLSSLMEDHHSPCFQSHLSPENDFFNAQMTRVCSTGDLQNMKTKERLMSSSPLGTESSASSFMTEDLNSKVGRYSAEERKQRIHRYRAKRNQRNFNKIIKYACRKTLADNRPRIRGRFARNDEAGETTKTPNFNQYEDGDDNIWIEGFNEEDVEGRMKRRSEALLNSYDPTQFQYYGYENGSYLCGGSPASLIQF